VNALSNMAEYSSLLFHENIYIVGEQRHENQFPRKEEWKYAI
jgi:hypothetical protein